MLTVKAIQLNQFGIIREQPTSSTLDQPPRSTKGILRDKTHTSTTDMVQSKKY